MTAETSQDDKARTIEGGREVEPLTPLPMVDFNQMKSWSQDPFVLVEGDGVRVRDDRDNWYLDGISGVFVMALGYGNERVITAMNEQLRRLAFTTPLYSTNEPAIALAKRLTSIAPSGYSGVKFFVSGAEATENGIKFARQYQRQIGEGRRYKILSHYRSYHGSTAHSMAAGGAPQFREPYEPLPAGFVHVHPPFVLHERLGLEAEDLSRAAVSLLEETIVMEAPSTIAALIVEPVMAAAGVRLYPASYLQQLRALCDRYGILLLFDEVITGFGRTGSWFAATECGVTPDILCFAKQVTAGYAPLSGTLLQDHVARAFWGEPEENRQFMGGTTFGGNPVSCAAALATLQEIEDRDLVTNAATMGNRLLMGLQAIASRHAAVAEVRGIGLLAGLSLSSAQTGLPPGSRVGTAVHRAARRRGALIRDGADFIVLAPPLVADAGDIDELLEVVEAAIEEVESAQSPVTPVAANR